MGLIAFILILCDGYKTYASTILAVVSGLGMILTRGCAGGVSEIFETMTMIFAGCAVAGLRHAIYKLESGREIGLRHAVDEEEETA